jgi:hypothetical protein
MQIYKSCHIDFGFNDTVCENLVTIWQKLFFLVHDGDAK